MGIRLEFPNRVKVAAADRAKGICQCCKLPTVGKKIHFDHILPAALGGEPTLANCQVLCEACHKEKTGKEDIPRIRKADRQKRAALGIKNELRPKIQNAGFVKRERVKHGVDKSELPPLPRRSIYADE